MISGTWGKDFLWKVAVSISMLNYLWVSHNNAKFSLRMTQQFWLTCLVCLKLLFYERQSCSDFSSETGKSFQFYHGLQKVVLNATLNHLFYINTTLHLKTFSSKGLVNILQYASKKIKLLFIKVLLNFLIGIIRKLIHELTVLCRTLMYQISKLTVINQSIVCVQFTVSSAGF
jgi:hypothetical protein